MRLDIARRQPARVEREDLVVEALEAPLTLPDDLRLERPPPIARRAGPQTGLCSVASVFAVEPLRVLPAPPGGSWCGSKPKMLSQLRRHRPLDQPLRQLREHTARADDLLLSPGTREQLVDHLIGETIANRARDLERRAAGRTLRSPYGLAPHPAGVIDQDGRRSWPS